MSQPHRKQSVLYVTRMSLIFMEVNKCACMEGIFHTQDTRQWGHCSSKLQLPARFIQSFLVGSRTTAHDKGYVSSLQMNVLLCMRIYAKHGGDQCSSNLFILLHRNHNLFSEWEMGMHLPIFQSLASSLLLKVRLRHTFAWW